MKPRDDWKTAALRAAGVPADYDEPVEVVPYRFDGSTPFEPDRRDALKALGAGLMIAVAAEAGRPAETRGEQPPRRRGGGPFGRGAGSIAARVHLGEDGAVTVLTGKVDCGQGARVELTQAAAEELRLPFADVRLVMGDTALVPDDGGTYGSLTTPLSVPAVRLGCAAARALLVEAAARRFGVAPADVVVEEGKARRGDDPAATFSYADMARDPEAVRAMSAVVPEHVELTPVASWKTMGKPIARPDARDVVTGARVYPSDVVRPGMLYGRVLRGPSLQASLKSVDLAPAGAIPGAVAVRDGGFVGVAAPSSWKAAQALAAVAETARWDSPPAETSSESLFDHLRAHARGGLPDRPIYEEGAKALRASYEVAYVQHCPLETRAAVAEWNGDDELTVWVGTQVPFNVRAETARAFGMAEDRVRVIVPDFGGGFGGKHTGEYAVEAARLARAAGKPVRVVWTRAEEFAWAFFRPAGAIGMEASLTPDGGIAAWRQINVNSGPGQVQTPYRVAKSDCRFLPSSPPLRGGSYRALASTANTFARESFMDELAALAGAEPLAFRLGLIDDPRLRDVLIAATSRFGWAERSRKKEPGKGVGLACGMDKGGYVACCAAVAVDEDGAIAVDHVAQVYDCGKIVNPDNLRAQVEGAVIMGLGPALREEIRFADGMVSNGSFRDYRVPRFSDLPTLDVHLLDRPDVPSAGAGETPIIAVAPAIANAVAAAVGRRSRSMPVLATAPRRDAPSHAFHGASTAPNRIR